MPHAAASSDSESCAAGVHLFHSRAGTCTCHALLQLLLNRWQSAEITFFGARDRFVESSARMRNVMEKENSDEEVLPVLTSTHGDESALAVQVLPGSLLATYSCYVFVLLGAATKKICASTVETRIESHGTTNAFFTAPAIFLTGLRRRFFGEWVI